jgi:hypothetical protein
VKSSGRDEPIWVVIHICMKNAMFFLLPFIFSSTKSENKRMKQVLPRGWGGEAYGPNNVYTCK